MILEAAKKGGTLTKLDVGAAMYAELGGTPDAPLVVEGVPIFLMSERDELLLRVAEYSRLRWCVTLSLEDAGSLLKAVPTAELMALAPLIVDQHLDDHNYDDPVEEMTAKDVARLREKLRELGFGVKL